jgi:maltose alpha-D-glucosyltransferase / alpha-amylase
LSDCESVATAIGRRLGEMHAVLARPTSETAFAPQIASASQAVDWGRTAQERLEAALDMIATRVGWERPEDQERAAELLHLRKELVAAVRKLAQSAEGSAMTRIHGDFHLGQVLVASGDAYIIDFEGEPARAVAERRAKASPLRDVAGLLRSIDYAGATLIERKEVGAMPVAETERNDLVVAFRTRASRAFLRGYREAAGSEIKQEHKLLELFLIDKAAYEIAYEANNRPTWIGVPLAGLWRLAGRVLDHRPGDRNG